MKIFISHKKEDELTALKVVNTLTSAGVDAYLDLLDNITADDLLANVDGVFTFTANALDNISFTVNLAGGTTTVSEPKLSVVVQKLA